MSLSDNTLSWSKKAGGFSALQKRSQLLKPLGHGSTYQPGLQSKTLRFLLFLTQKSKNWVYDKQLGLLIHDISLVDDVSSSTKN